MPNPRRERGQILVIFVIAIVAIFGMVGLVLDGGSAFAQRRAEQNVSDLASMAGAMAHLNTTGNSTAKAAAADAAARAIATSNGYTDGVAATTVGVAVADNGFYATVRVDITRPHRNNFAAIMGMPTWPVSVTATAESSGNPNAAYGAMPLLFNEAAFPNAICDEDAGGCVDEVYQQPPVGTEDVPQDATQFNWTIFCQASGNPCNANSNGVRDLINGGGEQSEIDLGDDIGPLNAGSHTTLFDALEAYVGGVFPVPIVDNDGAMVGWAYFRLTAVQGASEKVIRGYFVSPVNAEQLVINPGAPGATLETGVYEVRLTN
jgi:Flp pilus assembly protein TadG